MNSPRQPLFLKCLDKDGKRIAPVKTKPVVEPIRELKPRWKTAEDYCRWLLTPRVLEELASGRAEARIAELREQSRIAEQQDKARRTRRLI